jgi:ABC-type transport system substrate-binding protein
VQLQDDRRYRATFSGFNLQGSGSGVSRIKELTSNQARVAENNYNGRNYPRYRNAEFDDLVTRLFATIPMPERIQLLQKVIEHMTDQVNMISLYYAPTSTMISKRVQNAGFDPTWNSHEWTVQ